MENEKIVLPDGEHLINGTIYVVEGGQVVSTKEVTEQQEEVIEEVAETAAEKPIEELSTEVKPEEEKPTEQMSEVVEEVKTEVAPEEDRMSKLESQIGEMVTEVATLRAMIEKPTVDETVDVQMAKVPLWKTLAALRSKN
jgi:rRNA maturation endonuclease Nob1